MNNNFIGVKQFDELVSVINDKSLKLCGIDTELAQEIESQTSYSRESYKVAFETLAKHVRGWAEAHNDGSLLFSLVMESNEDLENDEDAFALIQHGLSKQEMERN
ncbi:hypothetical protein P9265_19515 [Schinkia azotoformans]|uniref:hypothetical protein n=1 Tax=Schinkia azotoformans TaxID=1454 RepID=UPI002E1E8BC9|nr:hypothetical protein [Schinkia azotoformans]